MLERCGALYPKQIISNRICFAFSWCFTNISNFVSFLFTSKNILFLRVSVFPARVSLYATYIKSRQAKILSFWGGVIYILQHFEIAGKNGGKEEKRAAFSMV